MGAVWRKTSPRRRRRLRASQAGWGIPTSPTRRRRRWWRNVRPTWQRNRRRRIWRASAWLTSADSMIHVEGLSKTYRVAEKQPGLAGTLRHFVRRRTRDVVAVQDVSFSIEPGEMVGFLGANGAGKTTTLKMLCGLIHPSAGDVP